jgi:DNA-binding XRE family transcriptional regulator
VAQKKALMVIYSDVLWHYIVMEIDDSGGAMKIHIREIRERRGLTQQQLADRVGKKRSTIAMYEGGRIDIPVRVLCRIAHILKVPVGQLIQPDGDVVASRSSERG